MARLTTKNWAEFQHYKDRSPPWIKLHKELLDDRHYQSLPLASRALAPMLWLLASETKDGSFDADPEELAFRLRTNVKDITNGLKPLIDKGFFIVVQDVSTMLAGCGQVAVPETETETETLPKKSALRFSDFWSAYPKKVGKDAALKQFTSRKVDDALLAEMLTALAIQKQSPGWQKDGGQFIPNPATWLSQGRWQDEAVSSANDDPYGLRSAL